MCSEYAVHPPESIVSSDNAPTGCIPLIEPQHAHVEFLDSVPEISQVLVRLSDVDRLLSRSQTAKSYFPSGIEVITTSTVNDEYLSGLHWLDEFEMIREFDPDYHIPCDIPIYRGTDRSERRNRIQKYLNRMLAFAQESTDTRISIIPLPKALTHEEWRVVKPVFDVLGVEFYAFYGTQYFLESGGFGELLKDIQLGVSMMPNRDILLIGLLSPSMLYQLPPQVTAAAGLNQWRTRVQLREASSEAYRNRFIEFQDQVNSALGVGQTPIGMWAESPQEVA